MTPAVIYGQEVLYAARGHAYRTQVAERRLEQAAEDARSRPAQAGIQWFVERLFATNRKIQT